MAKVLTFLIEMDSDPGVFRLVEPNDFPIGESFQIIKPWATQSDLELCHRVYGHGWERGQRAGYKEAVHPTEGYLDWDEVISPLS